MSRSIFNIFFGACLHKLWENFKVLRPSELFILIVRFLSQIRVENGKGSPPEQFDLETLVDRVGFGSKIGHRRHSAFRIEESKWSHYNISVSFSSLEFLSIPIFVFCALNLQIMYNVAPRRIKPKRCFLKLALL